MGRPTKDFKFAIGERVAEKPRINLLSATTPQGIRTAQRHMNMTPRVGVVTGQTIKKNKRANRKFIEVVWDGQDRTTSIEQMRLCREDELKQVTEQLFANHG